MSDVKMNNSEYKIMDILWDRSPPGQPPLTAKEITQEAQRRYGWNKNTTYTVLNGLVKKRNGFAGGTKFPLYRKDKPRPGPKAGNPHAD